MNVLVDNGTMSRARALMILRATYSGWEIGTPILQTGMTLARGTVKGIKDRILRTHYVSAFNLSDVALDAMLAEIDDNRLEYIMGYPGSIFSLAERARNVGFNRKLKGVVTWGDNLFSHFRSLIERQFKCRVTDTYGVGEGIQVAAQCGEADGGYHIFMPHVMVEVVDGNGFSVGDKEQGEILLTRLEPGSMPLIRYRVGDVGRKGGNIECSCGRGLEILTAIDGRDSDIVITPNGNRLIVHFFTGIFEYYNSIKMFRVVQKNVGEIVVDIVPDVDFNKSVWARLKDEILDKGDRDLKIELNIVEHIPTEKSNKRRFVISHLKKS
jgi:phenylacetate-CoA ligase